MAALGVNAVNFSDAYQGLITGVLLLFYGISGTVYSQLFSTLFASGPDVSGFLLSLTVSTLVVNLLGVFLAVKVHQPIYPEIQRPKSGGGKRAAWADTVKLDNYGTITNVSTSDEKTNQTLKSNDKMNKLEKIGNIKSSQVMPIEDIEQSKPIATELPSLTPNEMLKSKIFWIYALITIFAQGLTYMSNISTLLISIYDPSTKSETIAQASAIHITIVSISQSIGRLMFGVSSDFLVNYFKRDRSLLLIVSNIFLTVPLLLLSISMKMLNDWLVICSVFVGFGFGAIGALFPLLVKDFFGLKYYGTACSFLMTPVPIGILSSNLIFAGYYDQALQDQVKRGGSSLNCFGPSCYTQSSLVLLIIQLFPLILSIVLYYLRSKRQ